MISIEHFFAEYDAFGERRAGSPADAASARWLRDLAIADRVVRCDLIEVDFERFSPGPSSLTVDGRKIAGLPLFDGGLTDAAGVRGRLGPLGSDAAIAITEMAPRIASLPGNPFARARATSRHAAIVVAPESKTGSLAPMNAHAAQAPFGPPVLQVPAGAGLMALAGREGLVTVTGSRDRAESWNVRAALSGRGGPPLVLLTPRTSWWTSTAERAGGLYAWLVALEALGALAAGARREVVALATCGHELGHIGAHRAFAAEPALAAESALVVHLGANLGAAGDGHLVVRSNVAGLASRAGDALAAEGYPRAAIEVATGGKANGEAHEIESRGGRYLSFIGDNPWFHAPEDRWPSSVAPDRARAIARAVAAVAAAEARA